MDFLSDVGTSWQIATGVAAIGASLYFAASTKALRKGKGSFDAHRGKATLNAEERRKVLKHRGWGYDDTKFSFNEKGEIYLTGSRYPFSGLRFPHFRPWMEKKVGLSVEDTSFMKPERPQAPPSVLNDELLSIIQESGIYYSLDDDERVFHGHGHTCQELFQLRYGALPRVPDAVVYPRCHDDVELIVKCAAKHNVCIIPFGGGTSVSDALECPLDETRMIISLDMQKMNKVLRINRTSMTARIEAGIIGQDLMHELEAQGLTMGHEPDSVEFSSLGGWVATRASGMKKNVYGNIEDIVVGIKMVSPIGTIEKSCEVPRLSTGPDVYQMILGSEGTLGVITEVTVKVKDLPECREYGSIAFPDFDSGVAALKEIWESRSAPASIRLVDNEQFQFGHALKPPATSQFKSFIDSFKKLYITKIKGFDTEKMCAATLLFEGDRETVRRQQRDVYKIALKHGGVKAGAENGFRGYFLTYMIAYLRDFGFDYSFVAESFETSVPWDSVNTLCERVKRKIEESCKKYNVPGRPFVSCRVTQLYDAGACVYFYMGFIFKGLDDPVDIYSKVEAEARDEILACGGSLSHHHGVGKIRKKWMAEQITPVGVRMLQGLKQELDPSNVFGSKNLFDPK